MPSYWVIEWLDPIVVGEALGLVQYAAAEHFPCLPVLKAFFTGEIFRSTRWVACRFPPTVLR